MCVPKFSVCEFLFSQIKLICLAILEAISGTVTAAWNGLLNFSTKRSELFKRWLKDPVPSAATRSRKREIYSEAWTGTTCDVPAACNGQRQPATWNVPKAANVTSKQTLFPAPVRDGPSCQHPFLLTSESLTCRITGLKRFRSIWADIKLLNLTWATM